MLLVVVTASTLLALSGIGAFATRDTSTTTTNMSTVTRLTGTTTRHSNVATSASGIAAVENNNSRGSNSKYQSYIAFGRHILTFFVCPSA